MQDKKQKTYQLSYRKQLIQLAKFYGIVEIKNYFKSAKRLTTSQIELILIKNKIKLPSKKTLSNLGRLIIFKNKYLKQLFYTVAVAVVVIGFFGGVLGILVAQLGLLGIRQSYSYYESLANMDISMLMTAPIIAISACILAGIYPAWLVCRTTPSTYLKTQ